MEGRTSIVIAHRLSTIQKCDRIVVLHKGTVVEDGSYDDLSNRPDGHFARLKAGIAWDNFILMQIQNKNRLLLLISNKFSIKLYNILSK